MATLTAVFKTPLLISFGLIFISSATVLAGGNGGDQVLEKVRAISVSGYEFIAVNSVGGAYINVEGCTENEPAVLPITDIMLDQKLAILLSGYMSQQSIGLFFDGCMDTPWGGTRPMITTVRLSKPAP